MNNQERAELQEILVDYIEEPRKMGPCILLIEQLFRRVHNRWAGYKDRQNGSDVAEEIVQIVCTEYRVSIAEIQGTSRSKTLLAAREQIVTRMYDKSFTYSEIARTINRHPSTVTHTLHKAGRLDNGS